MIDVIKAFSENIIDTVIISMLCIVCVILALFSVLSLPLKRVRIWFGKQMMRIANTMDYFLNESVYDD